MTPEEYINSVVGKPYEKGADGPDSFDCWGLIPHSFKCVEGVDIPAATNREACDLHGSAQVDSQYWTPCSQQEADIFCCWHDGQMVHIGRVIAGRALHAAGELTNGQVMVWPWRKLKLIYKNIEFYKYANN